MEESKKVNPRSQSFFFFFFFKSSDFHCRDVRLKRVKDCVLSNGCSTEPFGETE